MVSMTETGVTLALRREVDRLLADNEAKAKEIEELRKVIAWANNSLFGSHGFFLSLDGGPANEHHLDTAIENLKEQTRKQYAEIDRLKSRPTSEEVEKDITTARKVAASLRGKGRHGDAEFIDDFVELVRRLAAQSDGWRTIETAPRGREDQAWVILATPDGVTIGYWGYRTGDWPLVKNWCGEKWAGHANDSGFASPTHWQPLPSPPSPPSTEDGK